MNIKKRQKVLSTKRGLRGRCKWFEDHFLGFIDQRMGNSKKRKGCGDWWNVGYNLGDKNVNS